MNKKEHRTNLKYQLKNPFSVDLGCHMDLAVAHFRCCTLLKQCIFIRTKFFSFIHRKLQRTMDDIIHIYSGPVRLILLACLTIIDANVLEKIEGNDQRTNRKDNWTYEVVCMMITRVSGFIEDNCCLTWTGSVLLTWTMDRMVNLRTLYVYLEISIRSMIYFFWSLRRFRLHKFFLLKHGQKRSGKNIVKQSCLPISLLGIMFLEFCDKIFFTWQLRIDNQRKCAPIVSFH